MSLTNRQEYNARRLLSAGEIALEMGKCTDYVYAMRRDGFPMPGNRATLDEARAWLAEHPDFRKNRPLQAAAD